MGRAVTVMVQVLTARRHRPEDAHIATADIVLDGCVGVTGVAIVESALTGRPTAVAPSRPFGDGKRVLAWSDAVASQICDAILAVLDDGTVAVSSDEAVPA
jgi:hypothetical protein